MASLVPGYEYDIFISYRQKDNKYDGWVTEFVDNLKRELEATFKEEVSVYFDINPHDGLLETHDVDASLKEKLKCLVFIPIISRTYCDPKSFAWEHEFKAFVESASNDQFGLKVKLPNGNVANRVLPVRIHDLDAADINLCESVLGGVLRGVEFIYKSPGVNRPLRAKEEKPHSNLNSTIYRDQINKISIAIKEIVSGIMSGKIVEEKEKPTQQLPWEEAKKEKRITVQEKPASPKSRKLISVIISTLIVIVLVAIYAYPKIFTHDTLDKLRSTGEKISIAVMPFTNMTNDTTFNYWQEWIQTSLISSLVNTEELHVRQKDNINTLLQTQDLSESASISPSIAGTISKKLEADIFINGNVLKAGLKIRLDAQLIDTKAMEVLKSFEINGPFNDSIIFDITDSLRKQVTDYLLITQLIKENPVLKHSATPVTKSPEALRYFIYSENARKRGDFFSAINWSLKALAIDSNFTDAAFMIENSYFSAGNSEQQYHWVVKNWEKRDQMITDCQLWASWTYAIHFESPAEQIKYLKGLREIDDKAPGYMAYLGMTYVGIKEYYNAIPELEKSLEVFREWGKDWMKDNAGYAFFELGYAYHMTGQYKKERELYKEAEKYNHDYRPVLTMEAVVSFREKDSITANQYIERFIAAKKGISSSESDIAIGVGDIYNNSGSMDKIEGMFDKAERFYRQALALEPENPRIMNYLANFLIESNRNLNDVSVLMDKAMTLAPNKVDYYNYLDTKGWGLYKQGKYQEALVIIQKAWDEALLSCIP